MLHHFKVFFLQISIACHTITTTYFAMLLLQQVDSSNNNTLIVSNPSPASILVNYSHHKIFIHFETHRDLNFEMIISSPTWSPNHVIILYHIYNMFLSIITYVVLLQAYRACQWKFHSVTGLSSTFQRLFQLKELFNCNYKSQ